MSETEAASTDGQQLGGALPPAADNTPPAELSESQEPQSTETESQHQQPKANSYHPPVDLSSLPEDIRAPIEGRMAHLSSLMKKQGQKYDSKLKESYALLEQQSRIIEELQGGMGMVVDHLQDKSLNDAEAKATAKIMAAHQSGDTEAFVTANNELAEIKARKIALEQQKKTQKPQDKKSQQPQQAYTSQQMIDEAVAEGELGSDDARAINAWQSEKDETGNLLRPWAHSRNLANPQADPLYRRALIEAAAVFDEASPWANKTVAEKLTEVDRRMGMSRPAITQNVMGGNLTNNRGKAKISLTPNQERIAIKTKFGGPKAKSDADHLEAYRKQIERVTAQKGARK